MSRFNADTDRKFKLIEHYATVVLSVSVVLLIARWPVLHLELAPVSLFLCAAMLNIRRPVKTGILNLC